ncbi:hypothetical protein LPB86_03225 [Pedobacter sp. MC2016-14]|uniref:hypothetical protein n=1 Tax=Pedobacter sp. MC2016-14 TaxID=2897327 RepID=UPI001E44EAC2|nr:hypothetical protein [Pedobacter sp. MC2016-14]MCD0487223.1 hypothetical protein [Pedobacter sp. MC2016-14]
MSKKLEEYIKTNRKSFDLESPSDELWERISSGLNQQPKPKTFNLKIWLGIAASIAVILGISLIVLTARKPQNIEIADVNPADAKMEMRFAGLIEQKKDSLQVFAKQNPRLYSQFSRDLNKMDADYDRLKRELQHSPNQQLIVQAMVKNLEFQLQLISQQLCIINQVNEARGEKQI